ncbi:MAG: DUF3108 domain-containing protein [Gemmatimonadota bacterium]
MPSAAPLSEVAARPSGYALTVGERATYDVELKGRGVGTGSMAVVGRELVGGHSTVHASLTLSAGFLFAKVNDQFDSWFDGTRYVSRRFSQKQRELAHSREKNYEIAPEKGTYLETNSGKVDSLATDAPLDDVSFLYYVRTLPLNVGDVDTIPRYFKAGRDVIIRVLRKETIRVPAGTFETIVVQPTITNAGGLFGQGGKAEVYFTADSARTLVKLKSSVPVIGSISLTLRELTGR